MHSFGEGVEESALSYIVDCGGILAIPSLVGGHGTKDPFQPPFM